MLHQPSGGAQGKRICTCITVAVLYFVGADWTIQISTFYKGMASDIEIQAREILRTRERLNNLYVEHTGQPLEEIERVMDRDTFMDVDQAMKFGVIDQVLHKRLKAEEKEEDSKISE